MDLGKACNASWCDRPTPQQARRLEYSRRLSASGSAADAFCIHKLYDVAGELDLGRLRAAATYAVTKHEALRYVFHRHGHEIRVTSAPSTVTEVVVVTRGTTLAEAMSDGEITDTLLAQIAGFQEGSARHVALYVLQLSEVHSRLLVVMDHLVFDGQSVRVFMTEFVANYMKMPGTSPEIDFAGRKANLAIQKMVGQVVVTGEWAELIRSRGGRGPIGPVNLPVETPLAGDRLPTKVVQRTLPFRATDLEQACRNLGSTPFLAALAVTNMALSPFLAGPGYAHIYPSLREILDIGDTIGWYSGTAIVRLLPNADEVHRERVWKHCRTSLLSAMIDGWAIFEHLFDQIIDTAMLDGIEVDAPSVSVSYLRPRLSVLNFGEAAATEVSGAAADRSLPGRLSFHFCDEDGPMKIRLIHESGRLAKDLVGSLLEEASRQLEAIVRH